MVKDLRLLPEIVSGEDGVFLPEGSITGIFVQVGHDEVQGRSDAPDLTDRNTSNDTELSREVLIPMRRLYESLQEMRQGVDGSKP